MIRVLIADDHAIVRKGFVQIVSATMGIQVVAEASTGRQVLDLMGELPIDLVVLDLNMPDQDGLEVLARLKAVHRNLPVLILSMYPENQFALRVLRAGASGYLTKESAPDQLVRAIQTIAAGGKYVSPAMTEHLINHLGPHEGELPHERLSDREFQVMRLLATGRSVGEISELLSLSVTTVSTYRARVLEKLEVKSNAELALYGLRNGLI